MSGRPRASCAAASPTARPTDDGENGDPERGVFFMAYNASIAEQFEIIQRWVNSGNSTGIATFQNDPLMGVSAPGACRIFCFEHDGEAKRLEIAENFVELKWGAYLFVPSMAAIRHLAEGLPDEAAARAAVAAAEAERGRPIVADLIAKAAQGEAGRHAAAAGWKTAIEDFSAKDPAEKAIAPAVWAAIRSDHDGAIRVPYGFPGDGKPAEDVVLVAAKQLAMQVFDDPDGLYSMSGQKARMGQSFGEIFLGLDSGDGYEEVADKVNPAIMAMPEAEAFALTYGIGQAILDKTFGAFSVLFDERRGDLDLRRDYVTPILEWVCAAWFGIPDQKEVALPGRWDGCDPHHVDAGGWSWLSSRERKPRCPGDFMATSRYCFYPDPAPAVQAYGQEQGQALRAAVTEHFRDLRRYGKTPHAPVAQLMAAGFPRRRRSGAHPDRSDDRLPAADRGDDPLDALRLAGGANSVAAPAEPARRRRHAARPCPRRLARAADALDAEAAAAGHALAHRARGS